MSRAAAVLLLGIPAALGACAEAPGPSEPAGTAPAVVGVGAPAVADVERALEDCRAEGAAAAARVADLEAALRRETELRLERERAWLSYTSGMARLADLAGAPRFQPELPAEERESHALGATDAPPSPRAEAGQAVASDRATPPDVGAEAVAAPADDFLRAAQRAREERSRAVFLALRSLFAIEHVSGLDLLESGLVRDGATGPVVLRVLDERGRPLGSLYAERLRLEASRAARTLTLVLEEGWERRGGAKTPFEGGPADAEGRGGVRRIELPHVDPLPWYEALPELFREEERARAPAGDPRELAALRFELNRRLRADASGPVYRLESVMAREGLVLREVRLAVLTPQNNLERELFADRLAVLRAEQGLELELTGGSQVRGSEKVPFLGGRYRIFLPRADPALWEAAGIPVGARTLPPALKAAAADGGR
ncbi:MAG: hypothetical protein JNK02_14990 [Planctomycetes bacterium]|nr:hypothetical protein [Planctomycetota bacterium]